MKSLFILCFALILVVNLTAQNQPVVKAIEQTLVMLDQASTIDEFQNVVNCFQRIAMAEQNRWEPQYHLAYSRVILSFREQDAARRDQILDQAEEAIDKCQELGANASEMHTLRAFICQARIQVDASRGMTYSLRAKDLLEQAMSENPDNPRAFFLMGQNIYYTPEGFGGGTQNALPLFLAAKGKFTAEAGKTGAGPRWGAQTNDSFIEQCNNKK